MSDFNILDPKAHFDSEEKKMPALQSERDLPEDNYKNLLEIVKEAEQMRMAAEENEGSRE